MLLLSLLRRPALLWTVPETSSLYMVSTRQQACPKKTVATQTEGLPRNVAVEVSSCRECQSLLLPREDGKDATCVRCEQVDELLRGTEGPIYQPDPTRREVCCLPGAWVRIFLENFLV